MKNKKLLTSFLALNSILSAYVSSADISAIKNEKLYDKIIKNIEQGKSNKNNYKIIEQILEKKNKELKDLYLQNDYIVKPEYLEWQVFFSGFYKENDRGDNTFENADRYSVMETYSGKKTYSQNGYERLKNELLTTNILSTEQLDKILSGDFSTVNQLSTNDQKIIRNIINEYYSTVGKSEGFKAYENPQTPKEIDLGINIPPKVITREALNLSPTPASPPNIVTSIFTPITPSIPNIPSLTIKAFNPVSPVINAPVLFTPPSLTYTAGGFGQTYQTISQNEGGQGFMLGNYETISANTPILINASNTNTSYTGSMYVDGSINPWGTLGGAVTTGTLSGGSYNNIMNAFYSMVGNFDTTMTGEYTVTNTRSDGRTTIFISYNPYEVNTSTKTVKFAGKVTLNNSMNGGQNVLVGVEHQLLGCNNGGAFSCTTNIGNASSIFENAVGSQIILNSGINMIGIMIDSEGTQLTQRSETLNNGEIIIGSGASQSIGIDFGQYQSSQTQTAPADPYVLLRSGNIIMNGENSYGLRVGNMFAGYNNYYQNAEIDGSNGVIQVNGVENVGVSLSKQITKTATNPTGNIANLRIKLDGDKGVGILRNRDYDANNINDIVLDNTNIQDLILGDNASNSILIRSDKYGIVLDRDITIDNTSIVNNAVNNIVMTANDFNNLGSNATFVKNASIITLGGNLTKATGLLSINGGYALNDNTIIIDSKESQGMAVFGITEGTVATGENRGTIKVVGESSVGVYNEGNFDMTNGRIEVSANKGIGLYAKNDSAVTTISGGTIVSSNGGIGLYADDKGNIGNGATIHLTGTAKLEVNNSGLMLYNYSGTSGNPVGKFEMGSVVNADINAGGTAFYFKGIPSGINTFLTDMIIGTGTLNIKLTSSNSSLFVLDNPGGVINLSDTTSTGIVGSLPSNVTIDASSDPNYKPYSVFKGGLNIDMNVDIDNPTDVYNRSEFISSKVNLLSGFRMTGAGTGIYAIGQENYQGTAGRHELLVTLASGSEINLTGSNSAGVITNFGIVQNNGLISATGSNSVGIVGQNGSLIQNNNTIIIGEGAGIYGENKPNLDYGDGKIEIENSGLIKTTATTGTSYGIFVGNTLTRNDSTIKLLSGSEIDMSSQTGGVGISAEKSKITSDGNIKVGTNGIAIYANDSEIDINSGDINLFGDGAIGFYLTNSIFNGNGGTINIDGKNIVLFSLENSTFMNNLTINATPGSTYILGNILNGEYIYNGVQNLTANSTLLNGVNSAILLDTPSSVTSIGSGSVAISVDGVHSGLPLGGYTVEGENRGVITLGNESAGIYGRNGARLLNNGTITLGSNSVGLYTSGLGSTTINNNTIIIGENTSGIYQKDGLDIINTGTINSVSARAIGMFTDNNTGLIENSGNIDLDGDKSIGIYTGINNVNILNTGMIKIGNSSDASDSGIGIYSSNTGDTITNNGTIEVGEKSLGIYSLGLQVDNNNTLTVGNSGTGIYKDSGILNINGGSLINIGSNEAVGLYAINNAYVNIASTASLNISSGSYGVILESGSSMTNNSLITLGNDSIFVYGNGSGSVTNTGKIEMTGSDSTGFYLTKGGSITNAGEILTVGSGTANIGIYNRGVYQTEIINSDGTLTLENLVTEGSIINNANITLGDSNLRDNGHGIKTGYSVGIYADGGSAVNNNIITVGANGVGMYVSDAGTTSYNYGTIIGNGAKAVGIFADNTRVENHGSILMTGDEVIGMAGRNGAQIYNATTGVIEVTGKNVTGIYLSGATTTVENHGIIKIVNTGDAVDDKGMAMRYTADFDESNILSLGEPQISGVGGWATSGYTTQVYDLLDMPTLINSGIMEIEVGSDFNYDGIRVIIKVDPTTNLPTTDSTTQIGFQGAIPERIEIAPDFAAGTATDRYVFKNLFSSGGIQGGKGEYISQSLTWDATGDGLDLIMTRLSYTKFTDGLWYEDFGRVLNDKYASPEVAASPNAIKIFDKIDYIQTEPDFRHAMASLAGNIYANINQREEDIAQILENSLSGLKRSSNNTKENVKLDVIVGAGENKEDTDGVVAYKYRTTGILALREVERTYKHTFGYSLGYLYTGFDFKDNNESEEWVNTIQLGVHNKYLTNGWRLENDLTGRVSFHNIDRNIDWATQASGRTERSELNGHYETYSITSDNKLGKEISIGKNAKLMPYGAVRAMYITRPTFTEKGLESLEVDGNDAWSVKPRLGMELSGSKSLGNTAWKLKGAIDISYEYELADLNEREYAKLTLIEGNYHRLSKPEDEEGRMRTKLSLGVEVEDRYGMFLTGDYALGNNDQDDYRVGFNFKMIF